MSYLDLNLRLPELLLMRVDKMTMASSLEARVPFLDHEVVSFALGIPDEVKLRNGILKAVLKNAVRGLIPDSVIQRPKQGFGVPVHEWLLSGLPVEIMARIDEFMAETDLFDRAAIKRPFRAAQHHHIAMVHPEPEPMVARIHPAESSDARSALRGSSTRCFAGFARRAFVREPFCNQSNARSWNCQGWLMRTLPAYH